MGMDTICLETRRELTIDPNSRNSDVMKHLSSCEECSQFLQKLKPFDDKLKSALNIEVPEGLESRVILAQRMMQTEDSMQGDNVTSINQAKNKTAENGAIERNGAERSGRNRDFRWVSLAAALVLAVGLSLGMFKLGESHGLQNEVLAHIDSHLFELEKDENIQLASLNNMLQEHGLVANENIGYVRHISNCPIEGKMIPHLVVADDQGKPVTVMYIPWEDSNKSKSFKNDSFNGVLVGAQKGSFVIVSEDPSSLQTMEDRVMSGMEVKI
jgi:hypothetical protein